MDLLTLGECIAIALSTQVVTRLVAGRKKTKPEEEPRCVGYRFGRGAINVMRDDCTALRSQFCKDGRCTYHCAQMCKCEEIFK